MPPRPNIQLEWDLTQLYKSLDEPKLERDIKRSEKACTEFAGTYQSGAFTRSASALAESLEAYEALLASRIDTPLRYLMYRLALDANDTKADQKKQLITARLIAASNQILFYPLAIARIPEKQQARYLSARVLAPYRQFLSECFAEGAHLLTEPEERILSLKSTPARSLWISGTEKILANATVGSGKREESLFAAISSMESLSPKQKQRRWQAITETLQDIEPTAENELNALVTDKRINDELRSYDRPEAATIQHYQNDPVTVDALVKTVSKSGFRLSRDFYTWKAKHTGVSSIPYANRYDPIGTIPKYDFTQSVDLVREVLYDCSETYGAIFDTMLSSGQIDVYPRQTKQGGAFMSSGINEPSFILLNHTDDINSLTTLAHEVGHAIHSERSKKQSPVYQEYSTTTAETASTFFEGLVWEAVYERSTKAQQVALLERKLSSSIATVQRQIAFYRFEQALHRTVRNQGAITSEEMRRLLMNEFSAYLGPNVSITEDDGRSYVYIGHFRNYFYVYSYAYGYVISTKMREMYRADPAYIDSVDTFLTAGSNASVEHIFADAGVDPYQTSTFASGIKAMRQDLSTLKKLTNQ